MAFASSPPPSLSPSSPPEFNEYGQGSAVTTVQALLRQLLRITTTDGRIFIGTFAGTDKPLNIILVNTEEFRVGPGQNPDERFVGQVMLPWKVIAKVEAHMEPPVRDPSSDGLYMW